MTPQILQVYLLCCFSSSQILFKILPMLIPLEWSYFDIYQCTFHGYLVLLHLIELSVVNVNALFPVTFPDSCFSVYFEYVPFSGLIYNPDLLCHLQLSPFGNDLFFIWALVALLHEFSVLFLFDILYFCILFSTFVHSWSFA